MYMRIKCYRISVCVYFIGYAYMMQFIYMCPSLNIYKDV